MLSYYIVCRSLTYAQRTASLFQRAGISARILRSPKSIEGEGCSHCVKIAQRNLPEALRLLKEAGLRPKQVFVSEGDGVFREVVL